MKLKFLFLLCVSVFVITSFALTKSKDAKNSNVSTGYCSVVAALMPYEEKGLKAVQIFRIKKSNSFKNSLRSKSTKSEKIRMKDVGKDNVLLRVKCENEYYSLLCNPLKDPTLAGCKIA